MTAVITEVRALRRVGRLRATFVTALRSTSAVDSVVVEVRTSDGARGWGEATPVAAVTGETVDGVEAAVAGPLAAALVGRDAGDLDGCLTAVHGHVAAAGGRAPDPSARAGVDIALHDLAARRAGVPLTGLLDALLGGAAGSPGAAPAPAGSPPAGQPAIRVATDVTVSAAAPAVMADDALARRADGFTTLKLKVGDGRHDDVARVVAVRRAVPDARLRLDANQGWDPDRAVAVMDELERQAVVVELLEQPVRADDLDGLAAVTARLQVPVLADEAVWTAADVTEVAERGAAQLVNVKLMKCGGLGPARAAVTAARQAGLGWMMGCMMERAPGVAAAGALAANGPAGVTHDLDAAWWQADAELEYADGWVSLPPGPGLGTPSLAAGRPASGS